MTVVPYKHQVECVVKLGKPALTARLIADEMGLGKTLEALLIDDELRSERHAPNGNNKLHPCYKRPTLIVAPKASHYDAWVKGIRMLLDYWDEAAFTRNIEVIDAKDRAKLVRRLNDKANWPAYVIVHYEALRLVPELASIKWFHIICDEVHRVKNRKAQQTHYLKQLQAFYKTGCSGTPADDKPQDIWSVLNWLYPKEFSSYWKFTGAYCSHDVQEIRGGKSFRKITGVNRERIPELHRTIDPWYLRRTKDEVLDLPPKTYDEYIVDLLPTQRRAYDQMKKDMIAWIGENQDKPLAAPVVISQLVRLQQFALASVNFDQKGKVKLVDPSAKADRLDEIVTGNPNEPLVIFTQSRSMVDLIINRQRAAGISCAPYTGNVSDRDRLRAIEAFQGGHIQLFVATIAAGSESITLHRASTAIFLDRMWNPTKNLQAEDRLHRIGQENPVQIIDIMARDTVDQGRKQRIAGKWEELRWLLGDKTLTAVAVNDAIRIFAGGM